MEKQGWKILAIIFIILFIIETFIVLAIMSIGFDAIEKEERCEFDICNRADVYFFEYDDYNEMCYCYNEDGEEVIRKWME